MSNPTIETTVAAKVTVRTELTYPEGEQPTLEHTKGVAYDHRTRSFAKPRHFLAERITVTWTWQGGKWRAEVGAHGRLILASGKLGATDYLHDREYTGQLVGSDFLRELVKQHRPTGNPTLVWE